MKLFLASRINVTLDLIIPLLPANPQRLSVAFIATAADTYSDKPWIDEERAKFVELGFQVMDYDIKNKDANRIIQDLSSSDIIHMSGGNSFYLLNEIRKSGFDKAIKKLLSQGKIYCGSSAGSIVMGPSLDYITSVEHIEDVPDIKDYTGMGYIEERIVPHYGRDKYKARHDIIHREWGDKVTFLSDEQVIITNGENKYVASIT